MSTDTPDSEIILETRNVFIDTSAFEAQSFDFTAGDLKILANAENIKIFTTTVTEKEVRARLSISATESVAQHKSFSDKARVLRSLAETGYEPLFKKFTAAEVNAHFQEKFDTFLRQASVVILPVTNISVDEIVDRYFAADPPFGDGKKKSEFPDAFAIVAVRDWTNDNDQKMYVVAKDGDMEGYCDGEPRLIHIDSIKKFLELVVREDKASASHVRDLLTKYADVIEERISQEFPSLVFYIGDRDGEVELVTITGVEILDSTIVELDNHVATVRLDTAIDFEAHVSYEDLEHAPYDSETKSLIVLGYEEDTWKRSLEIPCTLKLSYSPQKPDQFGIERLSINDDEDIELEYDDGWPYK